MVEGGAAADQASRQAQVDDRDRALGPSPERPLDPDRKAGRLPPSAARVMGHRSPRASVVTIIQSRDLGMMGLGAAPRGVLLSAAFFALAGVLEVVLAVTAAPKPLAFWPVWEAAGRACLHLLVAAGLLKRIALCRSVAMVYCLASLVTYASVLALALGHAPFHYPVAVVVQSLYEVPSCTVLLPYLRSREASLLFTRAIF